MRLTEGKMCVCVGGYKHVNVAPPSVQLTTPPLDLNLSVLRPEQGELCLNNPYRHRFLEKYKNSLFY